MLWLKSKVYELSIHIGFFEKLFNLIIVIEMQTKK